MDKLNKNYICNNTYIIINYTSNKKINKERIKLLDQTFNTEYNNFNLIDMIKIIRTILNTNNERTLRLTVTKPNKITKLVYLSNEEIIKYLNIIPYQEEKYLVVRYTKNKGLTLEAPDNNIILSNIINEEITNINKINKKRMMK